MSLTEKQAEALARRLDKIADEVMHADDVSHALAVWTYDFKRALIVLTKEPRRSTKGPPAPTASALVALEDCFRAAEAGGFEGDTEDLTRKQTDAAEQWIQAAKEWLK